jgi:hypothetical protein
MIKNILLVITLIVFAPNYLYAQTKKEVSIIYFSPISNIQKEFFKQIMDKNIFKPKKYNVKFINAYSKDKTVFKKTTLQYLPTFVENTDYKESKDLLQEVMVNDPLLYDINGNEGANQFNEYSEKFIYNVKELKKSIRKKRKERKFSVVIMNDLLPWKYSPENLINIVNSPGFDCETLRPELIFPDNEVLRPDEKYYKIKFDSVGYFDSYQLNLKITKKGVTKTFLDKTLKFSKTIDRSKDVFMIYTGYNRQCEIYINAEYLGDICFQLFGTNIENKDGINNPGGKCGPCELECLYKAVYSFKLRGYSGDKSFDCLWSLPKDDFLFQCPKGY